MEYAAGTTPLHLKPKPCTKKQTVRVSGFLLQMPRTPRHCLLPAPAMKHTPLSNTSRRASPLLNCVTRAMIFVTFVERKDIGPTNVQTRLTSQQSLAPTPLSPTEALWDLQAILDVKRHVGTVDITKKDEENSKQTNKVGNIFL